MKVGILAVAALCTLSIVACSARTKQSDEIRESDTEDQNQSKEVNDNSLLYGTYAFEQQIYMYPLSSFIASSGFNEYYILDESSLIIMDGSGRRQEIAITYEKTTVDKQRFKQEFLMEDSLNLDISIYKECYQLTVDTDSSIYRIYKMDDQLWLARLHRGDAANALKSDYIWSIFKIVRFDGEIPTKYSIYGTSEGIEEFLSLQGEFNSGYDFDTCYNITPEDIKQNSNYQIFKYNTSCASFLLYEDKIYPLGEWFGGLGVTSMELADLNSDGYSELYFTYSWGSGIHRSHVAYFDPVGKEIITFEYTHSNHDMMIVPNSDGGLSLYTAVITSLEDYIIFDIEKADYISDIVYQNNEIRLHKMDKGGKIITL